MANTATFGANDGMQPAVPSAMLEFDFALDTYTTGGVEIDALIDADANFQATHLKAADIYDAKVGLVPDANGLLHDVFYDKANRKIFLTVRATDAELANGAIGVGVINVDFVGFLR